MMQGYQLQEEVFLRTLKEFQEIGYDYTVSFAEYSRCMWGFGFFSEFYIKHNVDMREEQLTEEKAKYITDKYFEWYYNKLNFKFNKR